MGFECYPFLYLKSAWSVAIQRVGSIAQIEDLWHVQPDANIGDEFNDER
jgi:hypothetical protein